MLHPVQRVVKTVSRAVLRHDFVAFDRIISAGAEQPHASVTGEQDIVQMSLRQPIRRRQHTVFQNVDGVAGDDPDQAARRVLDHLQDHAGTQFLRTRERFDSAVPDPEDALAVTAQVDRSVVILDKGQDGGAAQAFGRAKRFGRLSVAEKAHGAGLREQHASVRALHHQPRVIRGQSAVFIPDLDRSVRMQADHGVLIEAAEPDPSRAVARDHADPAVCQKFGDRDRDCLIVSVQDHEAAVGPDVEQAVRGPDAVDDALSQVRHGADIGEDIGSHLEHALPVGSEPEVPLVVAKHVADRTRDRGVLQQVHGPVALQIPDAVIRAQPQTAVRAQQPVEAPQLRNVDAGHGPCGGRQTAFQDGIVITGKPDVRLGFRVHTPDLDAQFFRAPERFHTVFGHAESVAVFRASVNSALVPGGKVLDGHAA